MDKSINPKILEIRHEHYEEKRKEKVRVLLEERAQVIKDEEDNLIEFDPENMMFRSVFKSGFVSQSVGESKILERDRKQIEVIQKKNQKEIDQLLQSEKTQLEREERMRKIAEKDKEKQRKREAEIEAKHEKERQDQIRRFEEKNR